jgi:hypothetical protein
MDEQDAQLAFDELRRVVADSPLAWVLANVDDEIQRGRPGTRTLDRTNEDIGIFDMPRRTSARSRKIERFTTVTPFTSSERLELLVSAVDRVLTQIPELEERALSDFRERGAREVRFADDTSDREYLLDRATVPIGAVANLVGLLRELQK